MLLLEEDRLSYALERKLFFRELDAKEDEKYDLLEEMESQKLITAVRRHVPWNLLLHSPFNTLPPLVFPGPQEKIGRLNRQLMVNEDYEGHILRLLDSYMDQYVASFLLASALQWFTLLSFCVPQGSPGRSGIQETPWGSEGSKHHAVSRGAAPQGRRGTSREYLHASFILATANLMMGCTQRKNLVAYLEAATSLVNSIPTPRPPTPEPVYIPPPVSWSLV